VIAVRCCCRYRGGGLGPLRLGVVVEAVMGGEMEHRASINRPHPFGKGRSSCSSSLASEGAVAVCMEPTSLSRGEGLARRGSTVELGGREGEGEGCGWWRKGRE